MEWTELLNFFINNDKKTIYFSKPCSVSLRQCQMEIADKETGDVKTVPIEDIGIVLVENQRVSMTMPIEREFGCAYKKGKMFYTR